MGWQKIVVRSNDTKEPKNFDDYRVTPGSKAVLSRAQDADNFCQTDLPIYQLEDMLYQAEKRGESVTVYHDGWQMVTKKNFNDL